jgi:phosphatidylinositol glycan class T
MFKRVCLLGFCLQVLAFPTNEYFNERLTINTLQDGKVASKFTFTTLLKGVSPRNPMTLHDEDECRVSLFLSVAEQSFINTRHI